MKIKKSLSLSHNLNMRKRGVNMTSVINALIEHEQTSIIAKGNYEIFFLFVFAEFKI